MIAPVVLRDGVRRASMSLTAVTRESRRSLRVAVFGGSGAVGHLVIAKALARGWRVIAYVRDSARLSLVDERLEVLEGELDDADAISSAIDGCDAVISVIGPGFLTWSLVIVRGEDNIIRGMKSHAVRRLISLSTPSYRSAKDGSDAVFALVVSAIRILLPVARRNIVEMGASVERSGLDWTLVRIPLLSNAPESGVLVKGWVGEPGVTFSRVPRAMVAEFMVAQVEASEYLCEAPVISHGQR